MGVRPPGWVGAEVLLPGILVVGWSGLEAHPGREVACMTLWDPRRGTLGSLFLLLRGVLWLSLLSPPAWLYGKQICV